MMRPLALVCACIPGLATAGPAWDEVRAALFDDLAIAPAASDLVINAPYRSASDSRTRLGAEVRPDGGEAVTALTLVIDENPMPVSAVVRFADPQPEVRFAATMRLDRSTPVHVVAELTDGTAIVAESFVKTSGEGACSAPPGSDPKLALATLGDMELAIATPAAAQDASAAERLAGLGRRTLDMTISHPSHSGLQRDQITLLYIPMRYISEIAVVADGRPFATI